VTKIYSNIPHIVRRATKLGAIGVNANQFTKALSVIGPVADWQLMAA